MIASHEHNLPIIQRHVQQMGWGDAHTEVQLGRSGERCDVWGRAEVPMSGILRGVTSDVQADLWAGATSVHEFKSSVADLQADLKKPWRRRDRRALGEHRFYWLSFRGEVRPEHIDEDRFYGWGVVVFSENSYQIARPSRRFACAYHDTINLVVELQKREMYRALERQKLDLLGAMPVPASAVALQRHASASTPAPATSALLDLVDEFLADGFGTTGMIVRFLREKHGRKITASKLVAEMRMSNRYIVPEGAGGSWCRVPQEATS